MLFSIKLDTDLWCTELKEYQASSELENRRYNVGNNQPRVIVALAVKWEFKSNFKI